ncbi:MAG: DUF5320 family protein [Syntrophotaleaceae bacterium]
MTSPAFAYKADFTGCGRGRGRAQGGRGMLFRRGAGGCGMPGSVAGDSAVSPATEAAQLKSRIDRMERTLQIIKQRLEGLGAKGRLSGFPVE